MTEFHIMYTEKEQVTHIKNRGIQAKNAYFQDKHLNKTAEKTGL